MCAYSYLLITPSFLLSNTKIINYIKELGQTLTTIMLLNGFNAELNTNMNIKEKLNENPNMIDIILCNHFSLYDFVILISYLQSMGISGFNFILKKEITYFPGIGFIMYTSNDIKLSRNWEQDKTTFSKQIDNLKSSLTNNMKQVIIIFPEGTRSTPKKLQEGQDFSRKNDFPVYNNLLVPRIKGLYYLINNLKTSNQLGRIWDMTLVIPKLATHSFGSPLGQVYINSMELSLLEDYQDIDIFKLWVLENWKIKDNFIDNYNSIKYQKVDFSDLKYNNICIITFISILSLLLLSNKYSRYYLLISCIIAYIFVIFKL